MTGTAEIDKAIIHLTKNDKFLAKVIRETKQKPKIISHTNYYQALCSAIISQQLSVKAADKIEERFKSLFGSKEYPPPEEILKKDFETLKSVGLSRSKTNYIRDLAEKVLSGDLKFSHFPTLSNQEIIDELTLVKGIGVWTAHMFLMFCMGRLDILASGDLGIKNGVKRIYALDSVPNSYEVEKIAKKYHWQPYQTVACWYIWHSLDNKPNV